MTGVLAKARLSVVEAGLGYAYVNGGYGAPVPYADIGAPLVSPRALLSDTTVTSAGPDHWRGERLCDLLCQVLQRVSPTRPCLSPYEAQRSREAGPASPGSATRGHRPSSGNCAPGRAEAFFPTPA